jgi:quercetin dioxygenase-like cupin family protein
MNTIPTNVGAHGDEQEHSDQTIDRKHLLTAAIGPRQTAKVEIRQIDFAPGQKTGLHRHPCPVVGYIARGTIVFQPDGEAPTHLPAGSAFFEPANAQILRFDNASLEEPATFIAFYLLGNDDGELIEML